MKKENKKSVQIISFVLGVLIVLVINGVRCYFGGEIIQKPFQPDYMQETNLIRRQEAVEKYNIISGVVTSMEPDGRNHWDLKLENKESGFDWITVYTTKRYARNVNIGDTITVRGSFAYHRNDWIISDGVYETLSVGACVAGEPFTFHAQVIEYNQKEEH